MLKKMFTSALWLASLAQAVQHRGRRQAPAAGDPPLAKFGDMISIMGAMQRTDQDFVDGFALDLFSPKARTVIVSQNMRPLAGNFVTGSTGEGFVALMNYSYVIKVNEVANDLVTKVELPYDPMDLRARGIDPANTYVGTLTADRTSWRIDESRRNVHVTENKTRIIKMTSLDGEYMLLGRKTADISNIFVQYGQGATRTVNVTGGPGTQEAEFVDGLRISISSSQAYSLNADIRPSNSTQSVMAYSWIINTTMATDATQQATLLFPVNVAMTGSERETVRVARRALTADAATTFVAVEASQSVAGGAKVIMNGTLDGEYVLIADKGSRQDQRKSENGLIGQLRS